MSDKDSMALTSVPGFRTQQECAAAGKAAEKMTFGTTKVMKFTCVEVSKWKKIHAVAAQAIASSTIKVSAGADNDGTERKCVYQTLILKKPMNEQQALELAKELEEADFINPTDVCARAAAAIRSLVADYPPTPISDHQAEMNDAKKKMYRLKNEIEDALRVLGIQWYENY